MSSAYNPRELPVLAPLGAGTEASWIANHLRTNLLLHEAQTSAGPYGERVAFLSNEAVWEAVIEEEAASAQLITLQSFLLFEWFPRSPGLFHTPNARSARTLAMDYVISDPFDSELVNIDDASLVDWSEDTVYAQHDPTYLRMFDPYGKLQMLEGGVGSIRLRPHQTALGERLWFMTASSTVAAHEGFPVALSDDLYRDVIGNIREDGAVPCTLTGELKWLPEQLAPLYQSYRDVPMMYLLVRDMTGSPTFLDYSADAVGAEIIPRVSVAVSFESSYDTGRPLVYAAYVTFFPGVRDSLRKRRDWLEKSYIEGKYEGRVLTDFDEQTPRFTDAPFSLEKVMSGQVRASSLEEYPSLHWNATALGQAIRESNAVVLEVTMGDKYEVGQAAAVGPQARAENITMHQTWSRIEGSIELSKLADELATLRKALMQQASSAEEVASAGAIAAAEVAARDGDGPGALERLARGGKWALTVAEKIGVAVASRALQAALGL